jgi:hypothetical protein
VTEAEIMPRLVVGYTEPDGGKLKKGNGFLKPNFGVGPNRTGLAGKSLNLSGV